MALDADIPAGGVHSIIQADRRTRTSNFPLRFARRRLNAALAPMYPAEFLQKFGITCVYHFTDTRNLPSIKAHGGLLPWSKVNGKVPAPGGNQWSHDADAWKGQDDYVHLCFLPEHPMEFVARKEGRIVESRFLRIHPSIIEREGVLFAPDVANKSGVEPLTLEEAVKVMDFEIIAIANRPWLDPPLFERKRLASKYEILVPGIVPISLITGH